LNAIGRVAASSYEMLSGSLVVKYGADPTRVYCCKPPVSSGT
jgi:hypothetical protein